MFCNEINENNISDVLESMFFRDVDLGIYKCAHCEYVTPHKTNMKNHVESKHMISSGYTCPVCSKFCATKNAFSLHKSRYKHHAY